MKNPDNLDSAYSWARLVVTLLIATVGSAGMWSIIVIMPSVQAEFGVDRADASLPYTLTMIGFAAGNLVIGRAVDRYGVCLSLVGATACIVVGFLLSATSPSIYVMSAYQLLVGFGAAASFGPLMADISHWFLRRRGIAVAITACGNYLSGVIWPILLTTVLGDPGWRTIYLVLAVISLCTMVPLALLLRRRVSAAATKIAGDLADANVRAVHFSPRLLQILLVIAGIGCCVAMSMPQVHIVSLCVDLGYGPAAGAEMLSMMLLGGVVSRLVSGVIADRLGGVMTLLIGSGLQCIALFLYLPYDGLASLYIVSVVFGLSQGGIVPSYALIVREYMPPQEAGARVGVVITATIVGMAVGGWMSGWIYDLTGSYQMAFINGILWNLLNIAIIGMIFVKTRTNRPVPA
ncbi:MAG: MFS transporter [Alphaproteobacteria bacterium]|nr:MFS transporter [Alphaproteobacteria bacterium]